VSVIRLSLPGGAVQRGGSLPVPLIVQLLVLRRQRLPAAPLHRDTVLPGLPCNDGGLRKLYSFQGLPTPHPS
jgi:hypothetical protein